MHYRLFVLLVLQLCIFTTSFGQHVRQFHVNLDYNDFRLCETGGKGYSILSDRHDVVFKEDTLHPALPYVVVSVLVAQNEDYANCTIQGEDTVVSNNILIVPNLQPIQTDMPVRRSNYFQNVSYERRTYPEMALEYLGAQLTDGYKTLSFLVSPFSYDSSSRTLVFKRNISIRLNTVIDKHRSTGYVGGNMREVISKMVINGEELDSLYSFSASIENMRPNSSVSYKYLIVTNNSLKPAFEELAKWKTFKGVRSKIITVEEIASSYTGADLQEKIKRALIDYYNGSYNGLEYVLLGGDVNIVPARMCFIEHGVTTDTTPADMYYACLDGDITWDGDGDGVFGEVEDNVDLSPELFVTRIPVRNISDAQSFADRVIAYERNPKKDFWHNNMLMGGCKINTCLVINGDSVSDAQFRSDITYGDYIQPNWSGTRMRLFDTATDFVGDDGYQFSAINLQEQLSKGYNFVDIATHGNYTSWVTEEGLSYYSSNASSLHNEGYTFIFTKACKTNAFDKSVPCLSEAFMRNHQGGILGYVGCSRSNWTLNPPNIDPSDMLNQDIYELLFSNEEVNFGRIVQRAKNSAYVLAEYGGMIRWLMMGMNPLGDPEMPIYTDAPKKFGNFNVSMANGTLRVDSSVSGCRFCVSDPTDSTYYVTQYGNSMSVRDDRDSYQICVTKPGYLPCTVIIGYNLYLQNRTIEGDVRFFSTNVAMGSNVTNLELPFPVKVSDNGELIVSKKGEVRLDKDFSVERGGMLEIKKW